MQKFVDLTGGSDYALGYLGYAYGMAGRRDKALEILETLQDRGKRQHVPPYAFAPLYVRLGDNDKAIEALWRDYDERAGSHEMLWLKVFPEFDSLHTDPGLSTFCARSASSRNDRQRLSHPPLSPG